MLHHFNDEGLHPRGQGAICRQEFSDLLDFISEEHNILSADVWLDRCLTGKLQDKDIYVSFDDALRCQYDVALPELHERNITAFWFVYSSVFDRIPGKLEVYRYFRTVSFEDIDSFYCAFDETVAGSHFAEIVSKTVENFVPSLYLSDHSIYTDADRKFRFVRDEVLGAENYESVMDEMVANSAIDQDRLFADLWIDNDCLQHLHKRGHIVGLHSYSHPTSMVSLSAEAQKKEYTENSRHLEEVLDTKPITVSHPCNSYNETTLKILRDLGVQLGFRSNLVMEKPSMLELPREDHAVLMKQMRMRQ